jgi:hypothetical protein
VVRPGNHPRSRRTSPLHPHRRESWADEFVWCNPPYSNLGDWVSKAWAEWPSSRGIVMLLPANRVEQKWWQEHVEPRRDRPDSPLKVEFLPGRMRFIRPNAVIGPKGDRPPFGCALLIWREPMVRERPKPPRAPRGKNVLTWDDARDMAVAPDGTQYALNSEQLRGEGRTWWAELVGAGGRTKELSHPTDPWAISKAKARQAAEHHAREHHAVPQEGNKR